jgi:hypothetical protein
MRGWRRSFPRKEIFSIAFDFISDAGRDRNARVQSDQTAPGYKMWAVDGVVYGPVELPTLVCWVKEERVIAETWIYVEQSDAWLKASEVPELKMFFRARATGGGATSAPTGFATGVKTGPLRRVKILAELNDQQLERFAQLMEMLTVRQWDEVVKQNSPGDALYLILEGELRARLMIGGKETILATLGPGEFFGEMSLFDNGPRSADVIANRESTILKVSAQNFDRLLSRAPELAAPILSAIGKTLVARIRADNKRLKDSVNFARAGGF